MMGDDEVGVEVVQKAAAQRMLQGKLDAILAAMHPADRAFFLADLFVLVRDLRRGDRTFQAEWNAVLEGKFMLWAQERRWRCRLEWRHVWAAQAALFSLLERKGMFWQGMGPDPTVEVERMEAEALADSIHDRHPAPWVPLLGGDDDE